MAAFPRPSNSSQELIDIHEEIRREGYPHYEEFVFKPTSVDASPKDQMRENWADRKDYVCMIPNCNRHHGYIFQYLILENTNPECWFIFMPFYSLLIGKRIYGRSDSYEIMSDMSMKFNVLPVVSLLPFEDEYKNGIQATIVMVTLIHFMSDGVIFNTNQLGYQSNEFT
eukprot:scaffold1553_cov52-Cylindrotheca_fusiformis.AAC.1